jgi:diaminopimelate epimerase
MKFSKLQATGNDFILVDATSLSCYSEQSEESHWAKLAQAMCQRHFGIGADGLILVQDSKAADLKMRIFNPDGSEAEACGNGLRCFAKYVIEQGIISYQLSTDSHQLSVETLSGIRKAKAYISENRVNRVEVTMGRPQFEPELIPVTLTQTSPLLEERGPGEREAQQSPVIKSQMDIDGYPLSLSILSMGNPHAVSFLSKPVAGFPLAKIGPKIERHPMFPQRTNFEVARVLTREKIEARVWERGVGETLACGSGACAIAVAARLLNYANNKVDIIVPGGSLTVFWDRVGEVLLTGPVEEVFNGEWLRWILPEAKREDG